jgi:hypothetical protein
LPLDQPPHDANGQVVAHNHPGILANDGIIRRVSHQQTTPDEKVVGGWRISSMVFKASSGPNGGMSIDLQTQIEEAGLDAREYVTNPKWVGSIRFQAGELRGEGFQVGYDPLPDNPYHGEVWGNFSKSQQARLRAICIWFVPIDGVAIG